MFSPRWYRDLDSVLPIETEFTYSGWEVVGKEIPQGSLRETKTARVTWCWQHMDEIIHYTVLYNFTQLFYHEPVHISHSLLSLQKANNSKEAGRWWWHLMLAVINLPHSVREGHSGRGVNLNKLAENSPILAIASKRRNLFLFISKWPFTFQQCPWHGFNW